jgi:hypothetical protein
LVSASAGASFTATHAWIFKAIRSASVAHRKGSKLEVVPNKAGLAGLTNPKKFEKLLIELTAALDILSGGCL